MTRLKFVLPVCFHFFFAFASVLSAQPTAESLNGKTIHLYVESEDFTAFFFQNGDIPLVRDSQYHYSLTLTGLDPNQQDFFFTSNGTSPTGDHFRWKLGKLGLNASNEGRIAVADFRGRNEMWIVVDPGGPVTAPPVLLFQAPKTINLLNPWPTTAPKAVFGSKLSNMSVTPGRCAWFSAMLLDSALTSGHFAEVHDAETFGMGGYGSLQDFDFTAEFAGKGNTLWLNSRTNIWTPEWPGLDGDCFYMLAATVRDMSKDHVDFDFANLTGNHLLKGMVKPLLDTITRKPVRSTYPATPPITFDTFDSWWKTDSTNADPLQRSYETCVEIPLGKSSGGLWEYDSYKGSPTDHGFFPVEGAANRFGETAPSCAVEPPPDTTTWMTGGPPRNFNFCMESHAVFTYRKGQRFSLRGDDDIWMFINDKLVIDFGGVHTPQSGSVELDGLNLIEDKEYNWDLFYCDRQPCGSSLNIKTDILFKQRRALYLRSLPASIPGSMRMEIRKREGGNGSCFSPADTMTGSLPATLAYRLLNHADVSMAELGDGSFYAGGVTIAAAVVTLDTAKIAAGGLPPGAYRVIAFEPGSPKVMVEIPFRVGGPTSSVRKKSASAQGRRRPDRKPDALGRLPRVQTAPYSRR